MCSCCVAGTYINWYGAASIGTLTLAGDSTGIDWGNVENLLFDPNGNGVLTLTATGDEPLAFAPMGNQVMYAMTESGNVAPTALAAMDIPVVCAMLSPGITFTGIQAQNVNLDYGNIVLDLSGLSEEEIDALFTATIGSTDAFTENFYWR